MGSYCLHTYVLLGNPSPAALDRLFTTTVTQGDKYSNESTYERMNLKFVRLF